MELSAVARSMPASPVAFLFDLDGTLYVRGTAVPGATDALARLRREGVPFRFVTNTTSRPRAELAEGLRSYGYEATESEIFTPVTAAADIARAQGCRILAPFLPVRSLVDLPDFEFTGGTSGRSGAAAPEAVLIGDLGERWSYALMQEAFGYLLGGARLIALSRDRYWRRGDALVLDAGPFVVGLEYAASRPASLAGKPSPAFFHAAAASLGVGGADRGQVAMIGDDLWSDVRGAQEAGYQGWLVRTGKFREDVFRESGVVPDRILDSVAEARP
jgi:phospholysine phosphohistidine inorganic pyrophosphate phosphatase